MEEEEEEEEGCGGGDAADDVQVLRVSWRPRFKNQLASCSLVNDNSVHLWDISRPLCPVVSLRQHRRAAPALLFSRAFWALVESSFVVRNAGTQSARSSGQTTHQPCFLCRKT
jgi:hypothetical protein